jgi:hypothetical protein
MTKFQKERIGRLMLLTRAIRKRCMDCCASSSQEIKKCVSEDCGLYPYRNDLIKKSKKLPHKKDEKDENKAIRERGE